MKLEVITHRYERTGEPAVGSPPTVSANKTEGITGSRGETIFSGV